jgi:extracellular elastinolytic metalloproteinase
MPSKTRRPQRAKPLFYDSRRWRTAETSKQARREKVLGPHSGFAHDAPFIARDVYRTSSGERIVHAQQYFHGLRVFESTRVIKTRRGVSRATPALFRLPKKIELNPSTTPDDAVVAVVKFLRSRGALAPGVKPSIVFAHRSAHLADQPSVVVLRYGFGEPVALHLEVFPQPGGQATLAWVLRLALKNGRRFQAVVTATRQTSKVLHLAETSTDAFTATWAPAPGQSRTDQFPRPPIATPGGGAGTPSSWQFAGSNAWAFGPNGECVKPSPVQALPLGSLSVDTAFVWCNLLHDLFAEFGFDASHHAFQDTDPVRILQFQSAQEGGASFENYVDGHRPYIRLYASPFAGGTHAATDPSILIHEYAHGVSQRLVGGADCAEPFTSVEAQGFSEGLSDFLALTIVNFVVRSNGGAGTISAIGGAFKPGGIRQYAGVTDTWPTSPKEKYRIGRVWCAAMLDARRTLLIPPIGASENLADRFLWQVCIDALKSMSPLCHDTLQLTLAHAKDAFVSAAQDREGPWGLPNASIALSTAMANRGIQ